MLNSSDMNRILLEANDILKGTYPSERMECLLRLFLFKRLSDISDGTAEKVFTIPSHLRWSVMEGIQQDFAQKLGETLRDIEESNSNFKGVFMPSGINYWSKFDNATMQRLIRCFSNLNLSNQNLNSELLGSVCEDLIEQYISAEGMVRTRHPPRQVTQLIVKLIKPTQGSQICDPACGSGELLVECVRYIRQNSEDPLRAGLFGQEANINLAAITKINLILNDVNNFDVQLGDVVLNPKFVHTESLRQFDIVVTNPPFNLKYTVDSVNQDSYKRFPLGVDSGRSGNFLLIQHILSSLNETGRAAVLLPHGALSNREEQQIRKDIIKKDLVEAVIGLAPRLFYNSSVPVALMILKRSKTNRKKILLIDAKQEYQASKGKNILRSEHINRIASTYHNFEAIEGYSKIISLEKIAENNHDLSISRYVLPTSNNKQENPNANLEIEKLHELEVERDEIENQVDCYLKSLGVEL
jgi:type I restriction enzyme M protein